jgi:hypothetical protein
MPRSACIAALVLALPLFAAAQAPAPLPCESNDRDCVRQALRNHPIRRLEVWQEPLARPLVERVDVASPALVEFLHWDNEANGWSERPRSSAAPAAFVAEVKAALADLPLPVQQLFVDRLAGVLLVDELGGTGYTDVVEDAAGNAVAGYIVLDASVLQGRTANEWATWKEASPFAADPQWQIEARIERDLQDTPRQAVQYILLHELGHVLSVGGNFHPPWTLPPREAGAPEDFAFSALSWRLQGDGYATVFDGGFPLRPRVAYYMGTKLQAAEAVDAYAQLMATNLPTLYAATRPADDFAEAFASYVHVVMMRRPWQVTIRRNGEPATQFGACWDEPRCADKRRLLDALLAH